MRRSYEVRARVHAKLNTEQVSTLRATSLLAVLVLVHGVSEQEKLRYVGSMHREWAEAGIASRSD